MVFSIGESQSHIDSERAWLLSHNLKRKYQKEDGKLRPLGIPTMKDRAMQALYLMALDPIAETTHEVILGFRRHRCTHDAIEQCYIVLLRSVAPNGSLRGTSKDASTISAMRG